MPLDPTLPPPLPNQPHMGIHNSHPPLTSSQPQPHKQDVIKGTSQIEQFRSVASGSLTGGRAAGSWKVPGGLMGLSCLGRDWQAAGEVTAAHRWLHRRTALVTEPPLTFPTAHPSLSMGTVPAETAMPLAPPQIQSLLGSLPAAPATSSLAATDGAPCPASWPDSWPALAPALRQMKGPCRVHGMRHLAGGAGSLHALACLLPSQARTAVPDPPLQPPSAPLPPSALPLAFQPSPSPVRVAPLRPPTLKRL